MKSGSAGGLEPLSQADQRRFRQLRQILSRMPDPTFIGYREAEHECAKLAASLLSAVGREVLRSYSWAAIPRGGLFVLGMLAYHLDLKADELKPATPEDREVVIVDDCLLTGQRFSSFLAHFPNARVISAHLCAVREARKAIMERVPRVEHCLAARDLSDYTERFFDSQDELNAWRSRWSERLGEERFWLGQAELVAFAWSEPDHPFWNDTEETVEAGWRLVPPHACLKNRVFPSLVPGSHGRLWEVASDVVVGEFGDRILLYQRSGDEGFALANVAAEMWRRLVCWGNPEAVAADLKARYEVAGGRVRRDVEAFVQELSDRRLLVSSDEFWGARGE